MLRQISAWVSGLTTKDRLEREIVRIKCKIAVEDDRMSQISDQFFEDGGICCPACGVPGYSESMSAQERRERWLAILMQKHRKKAERVQAQ